MKLILSLLLLILVVGCHKQNNDCRYPTFQCLQGNWIEKEHTDSPLQVKEYIRVYTKDNREILFDATAYAQLQSTQVAIGTYYFSELPQEDSVALTPVWEARPYHRYLKMITDNEIEIDYDLPAGPSIVKKRYIRN